MHRTQTLQALNPASIFATLVAFCGTLPTQAQPLVLERADHAAAQRPVATIPTPPGQDMGGTSVSSSVRITQVNVNAAQQNIAGDAANEPSLAHDPRFPSRVAVGWRQFDTISSNFREAGVAWSNDAGRTWHASELQSGTFRSDPVLRALPDGTIIYNSLRGDFEIFNFLSTDGGRTWSGPFQGLGGDKTWIAVDTSNGPGRGFVHANWNVAGNNYAPDTYARSVDGGFNWGDLTTPSTVGVFGTNDVGPDGELYTFGVPNSTNTSTFRLNKSINANDAFATPTFSLTTVNMGGAFQIGGTPNPGGLIGQPQVVVDCSNGPRRGWVYVLATINPPTADNGDIHFARSTNGGASFEPPQRINPEPVSANSWQWFGTMGISPGGRLDVVYNSTDGTGNLAVSKIMYIASDDGGTTWSTPLQLTGTFNSTVGFPQQNKIGDYYDIESDELGASVIVSATFTGGQDVYYIRIGEEDSNRNERPDSIDIANGFDPDCNHNGVPDSADIASGFSVDVDLDGRPDGCASSCAGDFNLDANVDDADFVMFAFSYNELLCTEASMPIGCRADLNGDGFVDDLDFVLFAAAYDALLCP
jgi:hypothetical protein